MPTFRRSQSAIAQAKAQTALDNASLGNLNPSTPYLCKVFYYNPAIFFDFKSTPLAALI